jgi:hypothetical protein
MSPLSEVQYRMGQRILDDKGLDGRRPKVNEAQDKPRSGGGGGGRGGYGGGGGGGGGRERW